MCLRTSLRTLVGVWIIGISIPHAVQAQSTTYSEAEMGRFTVLRSQFMRAGNDPQELRAATEEFRRLLEEYPNTVNKRSILLRLFEGEARTTRSCSSLIALASEINELMALHQDHYVIAQAYLDSGCGLELAQRAAEQAIATMVDPLPHRPPMYHHLLGNIQDNRGMVTDAVASYEQAFALAESVIAQESAGIENGLTATTYDSPGDLRLSIGADLARAYAEAGRQSEALSLFSDLYVDYPGDETLVNGFREALAGAGSTPAEAQNRINELRAERLRAIEQETLTDKLEREAIPFTLPSLDGPDVSLSDQQGKITVVAFWAGWVDERLATIPYLIELKEAYTGRPFEVLLVNVDDDFAIQMSGPPDGDVISIEPYQPAAPSATVAPNLWNREVMMRWVAGRYRIELPLLIGTAELKGDYQASLLPLILVLDEEGTIQYRHEGFNEQTLIRERLRMEIDHLLAD